MGLDIKVVGNDAGEKLSILGSTLARLDRPAPFYGIGSYNDFNTFYMQAASGTSGGSSGSPVLTIHGDAVGLSVGGSDSSQSSFFLPLDRVARAVEKIKAGKRVNRGTIQTEFQHASYDELRRLGLEEQVEAECRARNRNATGLLTVERVLPGGPASALRKDPTPRKDLPEGEVNGLEPGDILLKCNGEYISDFLGLWEIIDESVERDITLEFYRSEELKTCIVRVQDLHSINPSRFLQIGGTVLHDLSYMVARGWDICLREAGVFCAGQSTSESDEDKGGNDSGPSLGSTWDNDFLVMSAAGKPTPNLDALIDVVQTMPDYERVQLMVRALGDHEDIPAMVDVNRHFFRAAVFERDDVMGVWHRRELPPPEKKVEQTEVTVEEECTAEMEEGEDEEGALEVAIQRLRASMVNVTCRLPYPILGLCSKSNYCGVGVIVSLDPIPLVLFDRVSIPAEMVDIRLTIANKDLPGKIVFLSDFVLCTFDRSLLPTNAVPNVPEWDTVPLKVREEVTVLGLSSRQVLKQKDTTISAIGLGIQTFRSDPPRHRLANIEGISLLEDLSCRGGMFIRKSHTKDLKQGDKLSVAAYYMVVSEQGGDGDDRWWTQGLDIARYVLPHVNRISTYIQENEGRLPPEVEPPRKDLGVEFSDVSLSTVSSLGLSQRRFDAYVKAAKKFRTVPRPLEVATRLRPPSSPLEDEASLKIGDIVLEIEGRLFDRIINLLDIDLESRDSIEMVVLRGKREIRLTAPVTKCYPTTSTLVVQFFGSTLHSTHAAVLEQVPSVSCQERSKTSATCPSPSSTLVPLHVPGVYVGGVSYGSPALEIIRPTWWILEVDGESVDSVQSLLKLVEEKRWEQETYVKVKQVNRKGITHIGSVKVDDRFWPCMSWEKRGGKWQQKRHSGFQFDT